jgi:hypothetical protein
MTGIGRQSYYQHKSGVEIILLCELFPFNLGTAVKYLGRLGAKPDTDPTADLVKCNDYLIRSHVVGEEHNEVWKHRRIVDLSPVTRFKLWFEDHPSDGADRAIWLVCNGEVGEAHGTVQGMLATSMHGPFPVEGDVLEHADGSMYVVTVVAGNRYVTIRNSKETHVCEWSTLAPKVRIVGHRDGDFESFIMGAK